MIVGGGGRESAFACHLAADSVLYAVVSHENPTIARCVAGSGGACEVGNASDPQAVAAFASRHQPDYVFVSADDPLASGVVDALLQKGVRAIGASRAAARIEWDKVYSIDLMQKICPEFTPFYLAVSAPDEVASAVDAFEARGLDVVVKPQGLTGGKGVKVMPVHLETYAAAAEYARALLAVGAGGQVLLVEKLHGFEFTIMGLTDGEHLAMAPATYDYPYRLEGDRGAGTGGMGCITAAQDILPFMQQRHWDDCRRVMQRVIDRMRADGTPFSGVLNGGFFLTREGIRFMEFNSRFGDPEALNIMLLLETPLSDVLEDMWSKTLSPQRVAFRRRASVVKYLVAKEYPEASSAALEFAVDEAAMAAQGIHTYYASCVASSGGYRTLKKSRVVAFAALSDSIVQASENINSAIRDHVSGALEYRRDIGSAEEVAKLEAGAAQFR